MTSAWSEPPARGVSAPVDSRPGSQPRVCVPPSSIPMETTEAGRRCPAPERAPVTSPSSRSRRSAIPTATSGGSSPARSRAAPAARARERAADRPLSRASASTGGDLRGGASVKPSVRGQARDCTARHSRRPRARSAASPAPLQRNTASACWRGRWSSVGRVAPSASAPEERVQPVDPQVAPDGSAPRRLEASRQRLHHLPSARPVPRYETLSRRRAPARRRRGVISSSRSTCRRSGCRR